MLKSMTAFGRACIHTPIGRFIAEMHSVNRKYLEINVLLPKELTRFDIEIKKWISTVVARGQINVRISAYFDTVSPIMATPNLPLAKQLKEAWEKIIRELQLEQTSPLSIELLAHES